MSEIRIAIRDAALILRGIYEYNVGSRLGLLLPRQWLFPVTYRCNGRCVMCNIWQCRGSDELSTEQWRQVLADPLFRSVESISLSGGEPTLREDLPQLTQLLIERLPALHRLTLTTNALNSPRVLSHCEQIIDLCSDRGIHFFVGVSLDGIGPVHDDMRGIPGAFDKVSATLAELELLRPFGLRIGANCTLTARNLHDAENVRRWCEQRKLPVNFIVASFAEAYYGNLESEQELGLRPEQRIELAQFLSQQAARRSPSNLAAYFYGDASRMLAKGAARATPCIFQKDGFILDARGDMQYCMYSRLLGNVRHESPRAMYAEPDNVTHRQEIIATRCARCSITCFLEIGLAKDAFRYLGFLLGGGT